MKIVIQSVPSRAKFVEEILGKVPSASVHVDEKLSGVVPAFLDILRSNPDGCIILQDDVIVGDWFLEEACKAIIEGEHTSFCLPAHSWLRDAYDQGFSYVRSQHVLWGQANYIPSWFALSFPKWLAKVTTTYADEIRDGLPIHLRMFDDSGVMMDDMASRVFLMQQLRWTHITLPNLANHRYSKSVLGHGRRRGRLDIVSYLCGKQYLRPWDKTAITEFSKTKPMPRDSGGRIIFRRANT
jgi:hypothetical protein